MLVFLALACCVAAAMSRDGELLGKIKLPGKDPAANLAFGKGMTRTVNGTGHTGPSEFCATSI